MHQFHASQSKCSSPVLDLVKEFNKGPISPYDADKLDCEIERSKAPQSYSLKFSSGLPKVNYKTLPNGLIILSLIKQDLLTEDYKSHHFQPALLAALVSLSSLHQFIIYKHDDVCI